MKLKFVIIVCFLSLTTSCSYKKAKGDIHPEIPEFPEHSNANLIFEKLPYSNYWTGFFIDDFAILNCTDKNSNEITAIYDKDFNLIDTLDYKVYFIDNENNLYSSSKELQSQVKYTFPRLKRTVIENDTTWNEAKFTETIFHKHQPMFRERINQGVNFDTQGFIDSIQVKFLKERYSKNLIHVLEPTNGDGKYLKYPNKEIYTHWNHYNIDTKKDLNFKVQNQTLPRSITILPGNDQIIQYDYSVMGNRQCGGRTLQMFCQYGCSYKYIAIEKDTTYFKVMVPDEGISEVKSVGKYKVFLYQSNLYRLRQKQK